MCKRLAQVAGGGGEYVAAHAPAIFIAKRGADETALPKSRAAKMCRFTGISGVYLRPHVHTHRRNRQTYSQQRVHTSPRGRGLLRGLAWRPETSSGVQARGANLNPGAFSNLPACARATVRKFACANYAFMGIKSCTRVRLFCALGSSGRQKHSTGMRRMRKSSSSFRAFRCKLI